MNCYNEFANYYNRLIDCDYDKWSQFLVDHGCRGEGLDLACGTGNITYRLAERGCKVIGVDRSAQMLSVAESKKKNVKNPLFRCQDITDFEFNGKVDFISCVCDGVNYLTGLEQVKKAFERIYGVLRDGGVFIFDVSSEYKLKNILGNNFFYEDGDDLTYFWTNSLKKNRVEMELSFFIKEKNLYRRFDENHLQYIYSEGQLTEVLREAGFKSVETFADYGENKVVKNTERITFCAVK